MFEINLSSLLLIISFNRIVLGLIMSYLWVTVPSVSGIKEWAFGSLVTAIGVLILALFPVAASPLVDYSFSILVNLFVLVGELLFLWGFWKFKKETHSKYLFYVFSILIILNTTVFSLVFRIIWLRIFINALLSMAIYLIIAYDLWKYPKGKLGVVFRFSALLYLFYGVLQFIRLFYTFNSRPSSPLLESTPIVLVLFLIIGLSMVLLTFNLIIIVTTELNEKLHVEINAKNKMYAIISHDLRSPISNYMNYTGVLKESFDKWDRDKVIEWIEEMEKSSAASRYLLENLLFWSRNQLKDIKVNLREVNVTAAVRQSIKLLLANASSKSINLKFDIQTPICVETDENILEIIIRNLISNSIKFTPIGGEVSVFVFENTDRLEVIVSDNGVGMIAEDGCEIGSNNQLQCTRGTCNEGGSGFGLRLCQDMIVLIKGEMKIESTMGVGTIVTVLLPK